ncbi:MAG: hypothetical protein J5761_05650 [Paludibacteraceae bacterium]|nr:hypothetical protein [Paludibacteraceae bacterium]
MANSQWLIANSSQPLSTEQEQQFTYYWYAAKQAITEERYDDALVLLEFCNAINPTDGATLEMLGVIYNAMHQEDKALELWRRAFEAAPRDQWYRYSNALLNRKTDADRKEALRVLEKAYNGERVKGKGEKAKVSTDENLLEQLLLLYMSEGQWKNVIRIQDELDRVKGYDAYSAYHRTRAYALWGKPKKALVEIDKYLEQEPTDIQFRLYRIDIMTRMGAKPKELFEQYEQILEIAPYDLMVLNNYAYLLATRGGDLKKAERMSQATIQKEPDNPIYLDTYGWILHLQGQEQLALFYLNKALKNAPDTNVKTEILRHLHAIK